MIQVRACTSLAYLACTFAVFIAVPCFSEPMKDTINHYFSVLQKDFNKCVSSSVCKKPRTSPVNRLFSATLKKHPAMYSLVRVNAKDVIINEVDRGALPKKVHKKIAKQAWYVAVEKNREYYGVMEENGKYFLLWAKSIISKKGFGGAVAVKIDLWDCFHSLTSESTVPFIVRINGKSLYSHKMKDDAIVQEEPLYIPGVANASLLSEKPVVAAAPAPAGPHSGEMLAASVRRDTGSQGASRTAEASIDTSEKIKSPAANPSKHRTLFIIVGIVLAVIIIILLVQFYTWLNHRFLMRSINREDPFIKR